MPMFAIDGKLSVVVTGWLGGRPGLMSASSWALPVEICVMATLPVKSMSIGARYDAPMRHSGEGLKSKPAFQPQAWSQSLVRYALATSMKRPLNGLTLTVPGGSVLLRER